MDMHHQRTDQTYPGDGVAFDIKGLDKYNLPRPVRAAIDKLNVESSAAGKERLSDLGWHHWAEENYGARWHPFSLSLSALRDNKI